MICPGEPFLKRVHIPEHIETVIDEARGIYLFGKVALGVSIKAVVIK
jgi:hypothetical protein